MLNVHNLTMTFIERTLFEDVTFDIEAHDKVGFIGANGTGKTTLFKILNGKLSPTGGNVFISKDTVVGYMEQHACADSDRSVYDELLTVYSELIEQEKHLEYLSQQIEKQNDDLDRLIFEQTELMEKFQRNGGLEYKSRAKSALKGLGFSENELDMKTAALSGGQKSKLSLAKLLLSKANLLLLDEPTNHLDIEAVSWLEGFIKDFTGAVFIISHDRYFLDAVTNKTIELEHKKVMCYKGNYSEFIRKKEQVQEAVINKYKNDLKEIDRIQGIIDQQKRWGREHNFITAESKQKQLDKIKEQLVTPDSELETLNFSFTPNRVSGNDVLMCSNLSKAFGEKRLFENVSLHIRRGERIFLIGSNGCGKTTLFKILTGEYSSDSGEVKLGTNVDVGYFDQMQSNLSPDKTILDEVWDAFPTMTQTQVRTALGRFLFKGDEVFKLIGKSSGGERARVSLLKLMLAGGNFLLLDEPTNHLDTSSREQLEKTLLDYDGTMLIISHDRYFINKLATGIIALTPQGAEFYNGNFDFYTEKKKQISTAESTVSVREEKPVLNDYKAQKLMQSLERKRKTQLKKAEEEIERLDGEIENIQTLLQSDEAASDYERLMELTGQLEALQQQQQRVYEQWEELMADE
ncbi:MAG: ABC-F family ATP-binding cassette domain-containing protein [Acutalibacteraceae bacterium]